MNDKTLDELNDMAKRWIDGEVNHLEVVSLKLFDRLLVLELANAYSMCKVGLLSEKYTAAYKLKFFQEYRELKLKTEHLLQARSRCFDHDAARAGGISDPRNTAIMRMFNLIGIGSNDGFGISNIFSVWKSHKLVLPVIEESFNPESITLKLSFVPESKSTNTQILQNRPDIETDRQDAVISYITDNITVTSKEISELLGISHKKSKQLLHKLMAKDFVIIKNGKYTLKA